MITVTVEVHKRWFFWPLFWVTYGAYWLSLVDLDRATKAAMRGIRIVVA